MNETKNIVVHSATLFFYPFVLLNTRRWREKNYKEKQNSNNNSSSNTSGSGSEVRQKNTIRILLNLLK